jgi:hypothetical protein
MGKFGLFTKKLRAMGIMEALLVPNELVEIRKQVAAELATVDYDKPTINNAITAIEDWFESNKSSLISAINAASSPYTFTGAVKKKLIRYWLLQKSKREAD